MGAGTSRCADGESGSYCRLCRKGEGDWEIINTVSLVCEVRVCYEGEDRVQTKQPSISAEGSFVDE